MTISESRAWAKLIEKLGLPYAKGAVIGFCKNASPQQAWDKFISCNPHYLEVAEKNRLMNADDVYYYFREVSYAGMRSTFPSRSHGRGIIGPRITSMQRLNEIKREQERANSNTPKDILGKYIVHAAPNLVSYGKGVITEVDGDIITVMFESYGKRKLNYAFCAKHNYISIR